MAPSPSCRPRMRARVSAPTDIVGTVQRDKELGAIGTPSPSGNGAGCSGGHEQHGQGEIDLERGGGLWLSDPCLWGCWGGISHRGFVIWCCW